MRGVSWIDYKGKKHEVKDAKTIAKSACKIYSSILLGMVTPVFIKEVFYDKLSECVEEVDKLESGRYRNELVFMKLNLFYNRIDDIIKEMDNFTKGVQAYLDFWERKRIKDAQNSRNLFNKES